jgi:cobalt-zinc-cadmium efflux system outer membrane protein
VGWIVGEVIMATSGSAPADNRSAVRWSLLSLVLAVVAAGDIVAAQVSAPANSSAPLTLGILLERVNKQHPIMAAARARVGSARGNRRAAGALPNPMLAYQVENVRLPGGEPVAMDHEAMATATVPLEFIYQRGSRVGRANAEVRAAEAEAQTDRQRLALEATRSYYETALAQVELSTARDLAAWLDSLVEYNRTRSREGVSAEADLIRAQLERDRAWAEATMQEVKLVLARAELAGLLGDSLGRQSLSSGPIVSISDQPLAMPQLEATSTGPFLIANSTRSDGDAASIGSAHGMAPVSGLLDKRPEVQAARERLSAASSGVGVAQSLLIREFGVMLGLKRTEGTSSLMAGMSLPVPIFDQNRGDVARARAARDLAAAELENTERTVRADIRGAIEGARLLSQRAQLLAGSRTGQPARYLAQAYEARRISVGAYQEGAVPLLQVLDAARAWGEARVIYYQTLFAQHESVIALLAAQGSDLFSAIPTLSAHTVSSETQR